MIPILMEAGAGIRPPFNALKHVELIQWAGDESPAFGELWTAVRDLAEHGVGPASASLSEHPRVVDNVRLIAREFRSVNELLVANTPPVQDLHAALEEVMNTYRAVTYAVQRFTTPALQPGALNPQP